MIPAEVLERAAANLERIIRADMLRSLADRRDLAFMLGDGSGTIQETKT